MRGKAALLLSATAAWLSACEPSPPSQDAIKAMNGRAIAVAMTGPEARQSVPARTLPGGSWLNSCKLQAEEPDTNGGWEGDYVFYYECRGWNYWVHYKYDIRQCPQMILCNKSGGLYCGEVC